MKKIYYLKTCDTCKRILKQMTAAMRTDKLEDFILQEIKIEPITVSQIEEIHRYTKSYETLFSRRAKKYKQMDLKSQTLTEHDYKQLILEEYTFLKRPVIIINNEVFVGNNKNVIANMLEKLI